MRTRPSPQAEAKAAEYAAKLRQARGEVFKIREERVKQWNAERDAALDVARKAASLKVSEAKAELEAEAAHAKACPPGLGRGSGPPGGPRRAARGRRGFPLRDFMPRSSRILLFLALTLGIAAAPSRLVAQAAGQPVNAESAAQSAQQPATEVAAPGPPRRTRSPTKSRPRSSASKAPSSSGRQRPSTRRLKQRPRVFEFLNFAIIVFGIGIPLVRVLPKILRSRSEKVRNDIESARKVTEEASARLSAIEEKLAGLDGEIKVIRAQVEAESRQDMERIQASIAEESARIVAAAEQEIGASAAQARRSLRHFAADLAIDQATKQLVLTPETDRALIAEFLADAALNGKQPLNGAQTGGQN